MRANRKLIGAGAVVVVLGAGGIAYAVGGDSEEQISGPKADKAKQAAIQAVGGGTVTGIERQDGDGAGAFEVEVKRADGSQVEVYIDSNYNEAGSAPDDDKGGKNDDSGENEDE